MTDRTAYPETKHTVTKRAAIAAAWLVATTVPLLVAIVFTFGCCVLPFHHVLHRLPLCHVAAELLHAAHGEGDADSAGHHSATPAPSKQQVPGPQLVTTLTSRPAFGSAAAVAAMRRATLSSAGHRNVITLGALRCDQDVGLHIVLLATFRI